jgi:hypothetical protein
MLSHRRRRRIVNWYSHTSRGREKERERVYVHIYISSIQKRMNNHLRKMTANIMFILQNMYLITLPITTILTSIAMLLPYWWTSDTFQVGLWRARSLSSSWVSVEPETDTQEGKNTANYFF